MDRIALWACDAVGQRCWIASPVVTVGIAVAVAAAMTVKTAVPPALATAMPAKNSIQESHVHHPMPGF